MVPYVRVCMLTHDAIRSVNRALDLGRETLIGTQEVLGYTRNRKNRCQKCNNTI